MTGSQKYGIYWYRLTGCGFGAILKGYGEIAGYEISRLLPYEEKEMQTPLGILYFKNA